MHAPHPVYYDDLCRAGPAFIDLRNSLRSLGLGALRVTPTGLKEMFSSRLGTATVSVAVVSVAVVSVAVGSVAVGSVAIVSTASKKMFAI